MNIPTNDWHVVRTTMMNRYKAAPAEPVAVGNLMPFVNRTTQQRFLVEIDPLLGIATVYSFAGGTQQ